MNLELIMQGLMMRSTRLIKAMRFNYAKCMSGLMRFDKGLIMQGLKMRIMYARVDNED